MASSIKSLAFVRKIHHPEGSVSAFSDASIIRIVSLVHGVRQSLPILGSLLWSLRGSAGLHAGHGSGSELCNHTFPVYLISTSLYPCRTADMHTYRKTKIFAPNNPPTITW